MTRLKLDSLDRQILAALDDDFKFSDDGTTAKITGQMTIEIIRPADDKLQLTIEFSNVEFPVLLSRAKTLEQLGIVGS